MRQVDYDQLIKSLKAQIKIAISTVGDSAGLELDTRRLEQSSLFCRETLVEMLGFGLDVWPEPAHHEYDAREIPCCKEDHAALSA